MRVVAVSWAALLKYYLTLCIIPVSIIPVAAGMAACSAQGTVVQDTEPKAIAALPDPPPCVWFQGPSLTH